MELWEIELDVVGCNAIVGNIIRCMAISGHVIGCVEIVAKDVVRW